MSVSQLQRACSLAGRAFADQIVQMKFKPAPMIIAAIYGPEKLQKGKPTALKPLHLGSELQPQSVYIPNKQNVKRVLSMREFVKRRGARLSRRKSLGEHTRARNGSTSPKVVTDVHLIHHDFSHEH